MKNDKYLKKLGHKPTSIIISVYIYFEAVAFDTADEERIGHVERDHKALQRMLELSTDCLCFLYVLVNDYDTFGSV